MEESQTCWQLFGDNFLIIHIYQGEMCRTSVCRTHYNTFLGNSEGATLISHVTKQLSFEPASKYIYISSDSCQRKVFPGFLGYQVTIEIRGTFI